VEQLGPQQVGIGRSLTPRSGFRDRLFKSSYDHLDLRPDVMRTSALDSDQLLEMNLLKNRTWNLFSWLFLGLLGERIGKWSYLLDLEASKGKDSRGKTLNTHN
jgi:hypothetical protein